MYSLRSLTLFTILAMVLLQFSCYKGPEDLPKYKKKFRSQIDGFEKQKDKTDVKVEQAVQKLSTFQQALKDAEDKDSEFKKVYNQWHKVEKEVKDLNKEYEGLKKDADNLFNAMQNQTDGLKDQNTKRELMNAITTTRRDYDKTLRKTETAVSSLNGLHEEALEIVKALEVAIAVGQISEINTGLQNIESRVESIMDELNSTIAESKDLYEKRIGAF